MKYQVLRKRVLMESAIIAAVIAAMAGGVWYLGSMSDDSLRKSAEMESQVSAISLETRTLRDKFTRVGKDSALLQELMDQQARGMLSLNHQAMFDALSQLQNRYSMNEMRLSVAAGSDLKLPAYKRATASIVNSSVTLDFSGVSDEHAYGMIDAMQRQLPGSARITSLNLSRVAELSDSVLRQIGEKGMFVLVKGTLKFTWFGIKPVDPNEGKNVPKH